MKESEKALQESYYTEYYAAGFDSWKDKFNDIYSRYDREIGKVRNSCISGFEYLDDKVTLTTFDNGYQVLVNFGYVDYTSDSGVTVPAREYKVIQEEK
jgi:arabinogalactan endo-1,4-beta-galactosidase